MMLSKFVTSFFCILFFASAVNAQVDYRKTTIYIVRHAEKDTGNNPILTAGGKLRAGDLMRYFKKEEINHIYTTPYRRTEMTGDSLRIKRGIDTLHYPPKPTPEQL